jgi:hypothetical protein
MPPHRKAVFRCVQLSNHLNVMVRLLQIFLVSLLLVSCSANQSQSEQQRRLDYPKAENFRALPAQIHVTGTIREISYGYCGIFCYGGFIKVELDNDIPGYQFKSVYLITACLSTEVKQSSKVDVQATLHTGREEECYYKSFDKPKNIDDVIFYKLSETETRKIR